MPDTAIQDPLGRRIVLHERTWSVHICRGHPEIAAHRDRVENAVGKPAEIRFSRIDPDCRIYYGAGPRAGLMIAVVADVQQGLVKTAYLARKMAAGVVEWS
jgi:hypothetical protein